MWSILQMREISSRWEINQDAEHKPQENFKYEILDLQQIDRELG